MPKVIDHDQRRRDILQVTWSLITEGGLEVATMREIARRAGFANGALKHYFPGKDDIILGTYQMALDFMNDHVLSTVGDRRGIAALETMCLTVLPLDAEGASASRVLLSFWERAVSSPPLHDVYLEHLATWRGSLARYLQEGREDGDIRTDRPDAELIDEIMVTAIGATVMSLVAPSLYSPELQRQHVTALLRQLGQSGA
ncbi:TetR/AcrR family transcriptional regulator [Klugiella xanthotipulae]|uniref:TetR family transcriptional regulator n=1 Tax=Klugiella xanthotipulae TaxID=244735 RepID=A0A543I5S5_9MICO|nr:TetR/AcrR family transcriptional regulator [Klugiella xanthotipulae]TQM65914.1 TetR family transcriptional regulator [Klugiella xanthotipulae]